MGRMKWIIENLGSLLIAWMLFNPGTPGFCLDQNNPLPTATAATEIEPATTTIQSETETVPIPEGIQSLLEFYAQAFQTEDPQIFSDCFWDAKEYLKDFRTVCRDWFDIRIKFDQIKVLPQSYPHRLDLQIKLVSRLRETRTKRLVPLESVAHFLFERRDDEWRIVSITAEGAQQEVKS